MADAAWEQRVQALWSAYDDLDEATFVAAMDALCAELPSGHGAAEALYERGSAFDSTGRPDQAVPLYRAALDAGLGEDRRRPAVIQLASSLRNLGRASEAVALLSVERDVTHDDLDDAVAAFLALALADDGREREGVATALGALARHLTRYRRSLTAYAEELVEPPA